MLTPRVGRLVVCSVFSVAAGGCFAEVEPALDGSGSTGAQGGTAGTVMPPTSATEASTGVGVETTTPEATDSSSGGGDASSSGSTGELDADGDGATADVDCNDDDPTAYPGAPELCDLRDNDCDGVVDWARSVPTHFETLGDALAGVGRGGHVCVGPGTYAESLTVPAEVIIESVAGPEMTVLSAPGDDRVLSIVQGHGAVVRGFTVTDGQAAQGAGVQVNDSIGVVLEDLWIVGNHATEAGASCAGVGLLVRNGSSVIGRRLRISDNYTACRFSTGVVRTSQVSTLLLENTSIVGNMMDASESVRSPITCSDGTLELRNVVIAGNVATAAVNIYGGAVYLEGVGNYAFENVTIANNVAVSEAFGRPGAVLFNGDGPTLQASLTNVSITGNVLEAPSSSITSGGVGFQGANVELLLDHNNLWGNTPGDFPANWESPIGVDGNIAVEPVFADITSPDAGKWDLRLLPESPLVDAGTPYLDDPDRSVSDIGAFGGPGAAGWEPATR